jgi:hypothetical protein
MGPASLIKNAGGYAGVMQADRLSRNVFSTKLEQPHINPTLEKYQKKQQQKIGR